jgi:hypothetical protein
MRIRRRNIPWLVALSVLVGIGLLGAGATVSAPVQLLLLAILALTSVASLVEFGGSNQTVTETLRRAPLRNKITAEAKEAESRAKQRGAYYRGGVTMLDIGAIAVQSSYEGMAMRRTKTVSKDDDGVRPYISLYVDPREANRNAIVRFEVIDHQGEPKFVYEVKKYLREGEITVMSDNYLPLSGNQDVRGAGDWETRVYVDGNLMGVHDIILTPSINERTSRLARSQPRESIIEDEADVIFDVMDEVKQDRTPSLQDLLEKSDKPDTDDNIRRRATTARRRR